MWVILALQFVSGVSLGPLNACYYRCTANNDNNSNCSYKVCGRLSLIVDALVLVDVIVLLYALIKMKQ